MKLLKRIFTVLLCILFMLPCLPGCGARETDVKQVIGVSLANLSEEWRLMLKYDLEGEAKIHDGLRLVVMDAAGDSKKQTADVGKLLSYGVDLLIISPSDVGVITPVISRAYEKIPVIVIDRAVEGYDYSLFIGPDNRLIGSQAADAVLKLLREDNTENGTVLELSAGGYASSNRSAEFVSRLTAAGISTKSLRIKNSTRDCAEDTLLDDPDILRGVDVIFAHNDYMAYGAYLAMQKLGRKNVRIVGLDGFPGERGGLKLVEEGIIDATVTCPSGGREAIQYGLDILNHKVGIPKQIILHSHQIWPENVNDYQTKPLIAQREGKIRVGYAQIQEDSRWRIASTESIKKAAKDFGIDLKILYNELSVDVQREQVREFIEQDMDVIVISPVVTDGWEEVLTEAKEAGIPVLLVDRAVSGAEMYAESFIGADFEEEGRRCARWVVNETEKWKDVRIMELRGTEGASPAKSRKEGFESVIEGCKKYKIVCSLCGNFSREEGYEAVKEYLDQDGRNIDIIFAHNDEMAIGAIQALREAGLKPGQDVKIVSVDGTSDALNRLRGGEMNCVVECNPLLGPQLMKAITDLMDGKELPLRIITDEVVFDADTPAEYFAGRKY